MKAMLAIVLIVSSATLAGSQATTPPPGAPAPNFSLQVWGDAIADFSGRVQQYFDLRKKLEGELPPLVQTDRASDIINAELALAERVRRARRPAKQGAIF